MGLGVADLRGLALDASFEYLPGAVDATVTPVGGSAISTRVLWLTVAPDESPAGDELQRLEPGRAMAIRRSDVPTLPVGSTVVAPLIEGGSNRTWRTDGPAYDDVDHRRVLVVEDGA